MIDVYAAPAAEATAAGLILEIFTEWRGDPPFEYLEAAAQALAPIDGARARLVLDQVYIAAVALGLRASVVETYVDRVATLSDLKFYSVTEQARRRAAVAAGMTVDVAVARNTGLAAS